MSISRNCRASLCFALLAWLIPAVAFATDIDVVALIKGKATLVIDKGQPRTLSVGQTSPEGVKLLEADADSATVEVNGKRETIAAGARGSVVAAGASIGGSGLRKVTLYPNSLGHFVSIGSVNGVPVRFMVDSGATSVVLPVSEAKRAGVDYLHGQSGSSMTANGMIGVYRVTLNSVKVGELELRDVPAEVIATPMNESLLGMSFLSRVEMQRNGQYMTLAQKDPERAAGDAQSSNLPGHARVSMKQQGGHFYAAGSINGSPINFTVDTGASMVSISVQDARRMGINYLHGQQAYTSTANGRTPVYLMKFDEVKVGDIVLHNVDGAVLDGGGLPVALLGMSFLNRTDIQRDGTNMTLTQRF
jgi:aspartyl protease family protein